MKRFTETNKWNDSWFIALSPNAKVLLSYIYDNCDDAGFIDVRFEVWLLETKIPNKIALNEALIELQSILLSNKRDKKLYLTIFLRQEMKLPLYSDNDEHRYIIEKLRRNLPKFDDAKEIQYIIDEVTIKTPLVKKRALSEANTNFKAPTYEEFKAEFLKQKPEANEEFDIKYSFNRYASVDWIIGRTKEKMKSLPHLISHWITNSKKHNNGASKTFATSKPKYEEQDDF